MSQPNRSAATIGFENELWRAADALRSNMDAAEYKHVVLGLIFLKYISDAFEEVHARLTAEIAQGDAANRSRDVLGRVYEYFLSQFAGAEDKKGGQFYTPNCIVRLLVAMLAPYKGRVLDPCCGSGGMFVQDDRRWQYGVPPTSNANFAWVQHFIYHLAPIGLAGLVLANGSMSSNQSGEGEIRKSIIEADLVDCMVALPGQLFYSTQIPVCLWFIARDKRAGLCARPNDPNNVGADLRVRPFRDRRGYHAWRGDYIVRADLRVCPTGGDTEEGRHTGRPLQIAPYTDIPGFCFCKSATLDDKIELNRQMNQTLEDIARALFKSWFVDFDPVQAKRRGGPVCPPLPRHIAALFPDGFVASELREIPKGWKVNSILEISELLSGGTPSTKVPEYWNGSIKRNASSGGVYDL